MPMKCLLKDEYPITTMELDIGRNRSWMFIVTIVSLLIMEVGMCILEK